MSTYSKLIRPLLFRFDPERVHDWTIRAGEVMGPIQSVRRAMQSLYGFSDKRLEVELCGISFPNPVGLAAGYDKNGRTIEAMAALGFGYLEIGSISADRSEGNLKPRLFRIPLDRAIVVNYGLPNDGAEAVAVRLSVKRPLVPLGINIVKTNRGITGDLDSSDEIISDYLRSMKALEGLGDYICLNLSCPNTEMGRDFFADSENTVRLMSALSEFKIQRPVFLKVSPSGGVKAIEDLLEAVDGVDFISGFVFNLPQGKPENVDFRTSRQILELMPGAVSGRPVKQQIDRCIGEMFKRMDRNRYRIIGTGGVFSAEDAYHKIRLGASLIQILTAMVYEGPGVVKRINQGLCRLIERDGFSNLAEVVGTGTHS